MVVTPLLISSFDPQIVIKQSFFSFFVPPMGTHLGLGSDDVSSIVGLKLRPEELPRKQYLTVVELKTKSLWILKGEKEKQVISGSCRGKK